MHKGFKCLDVASGQVYISRDVVFYETIYPFANLHSNTGARLRSEISLLPDHFLPSYYGHGDATNYDSSCANPTNVPVEEDLSLGNSSSAANLVQNRGNTRFPTSASGSGAGTHFQDDAA
jgi:hypothetical protein